MPLSTAGFRSLKPAEVTFVVPTRAWEERFLEEHAGKQSGRSWFDADLAMAIERSPWHFVVLEDLGLRIDAA